MAQVTERHSNCNCCSSSSSGSSTSGGSSSTSGGGGGGSSSSFSCTCHNPACTGCLGCSPDTIELTFSGITTCTECSHVFDEEVGWFSLEVVNLSLNGTYTLNSISPCNWQHIITNGMSYKSWYGQGCVGETITFTDNIIIDVSLINGDPFELEIIAHSPGVMSYFEHIESPYVGPCSWFGTTYNNDVIKCCTDSTDPDCSFRRLLMPVLAYGGSAIITACP